MLMRMKIEFTGKDEEELHWAAWVWSSHKWVEYAPGYFKCEFCEIINTTYSPMSSDANSFCRKNPYLTKFLKIRHQKE